MPKIPYIKWPIFLNFSNANGSFLNKNSVLKYMPITNTIQMIYFDIKKKLFTLTYPNAAKTSIMPRSAQSDRHSKIIENIFKYTNSCLLFEHVFVNCFY